MEAISELLGVQTDAAVAVTSAVAVTFGLSLLVHVTKPKASVENRLLPLVPPTTLPFLKNILDIGGHAERFHDWLNDQSIAFENRPWMYAIPGRPAMIVLSSPELFKDVLVTQANVFLRGPVARSISFDIFGNGMVISDGAPWFYHRKTASHLFSMQRMREAMETTVCDLLSTFVDVLNVYAKRRESFSMKKELSHFTMDAIGKIGFGIDMETLKDTLDRADDHEFLTAFNEGSVAFGVRIQSPLWLWKVKKYLHIGWEKILMDNLQIMNAFISNVIVDSMNRKAALAAQGKEMEAKDLVSMFLEKRLKETENIQMEDDDATIMRDMVMTFVFAGKDSTAHSMGWFIVNMNRYPNVLRKIREEIHRVVPGLITGEIKVPTHAQLESLVYLEATIKENIRLHPSTGFIVREAMQDTTLIDGTFIQKGQSIMMSSYCNARNRKTWGDDCLEFKPERMIDAQTGKLRVFSPYVFSGFGSGQHVCIGQKFALMEIKLAMATLFSKFDITTVDDPWSFTYEFSLTIPVKGPLNVQVTPFMGLAPPAA
ncbi:hypothetical protein CCR75_009147 [Bremia lactucae]|uniref:Cytochrome P450 n=1 Tax=Bremia lactucae TaxID=4779 RepID=A0A976FM59_BRELC|nr:hypothetical protein CCR75_009147 [Bremia lactucae]